MAKSNPATDAESDSEPTTRAVGFVIVEGRSGERLMRRRYFKDDAGSRTRALSQANERAGAYPDGGHVIDLEDE